jgi:hypothetical protein
VPRVLPLRSVALLACVHTVEKQVDAVLDNWPPNTA